MIKSLGKFTLAGILAAVVLGMPLTMSAQEQSKSAPTAPAKGVKPRALPFRGKLGSVDKTAKTITLDDKAGKRVYNITSDTKFIKDGKPATLDDATVGEDVRGSYVKTDDGKMEAKSIFIGAKPPVAAKSGAADHKAPAAPAKQ